MPFLFSFLILKEKLTPIQVTAVCGAFIGSLFIIKPTFLNMNIVPSLIGLCGGLCAGIAYTMVRVLGQRGQKGVSVVLFFSGFSCLVTLPYLLLNYHTMSMWQGIVLLGAGVAAAGGQFAITAAYYHAPAREISVYDYSQIIFSVDHRFCHCFIRSRTVTVCWGMSSSSAWQYGCSSITSVGMHRT